jgi:hypothetical protein
LSETSTTPVNPDSAGEVTSTLANPLGAASFELFQLIVAIGFITLGLCAPLILGFWNRNENMLVSSVLVASIGGVALFETYVGITGDDHSERILTRHIEYLVPLVLVFGFIEYQRQRSQSKSLFFVSTALIGFLVIAGAIMVRNLPQHQVSDGATVAMSIFWDGGFTILTVLVTGALVFSQFFKSRVVALSALTALSLSAIGSFADGKTTFEGELVTDKFGRALAKADILEGRQLVVLTTNKGQGELLRFYTIPERAIQREFQEGSDIDLSGYEDPDMIIVTLGQLNPITDCQLQPLGEFSYFDCSNLGN